MNNQWFGPSIAPAAARLYWAYLGRTPDYSGLMYWTNKRRSRLDPVTRISPRTAASSEFRRKYGSLSEPGVRHRIYTDVLGRTADTAGVNYWTRKLDTGTSHAVRS
ncbi:MAG: DUF4214 domain-containing protein [Acidimicrobiales bacterium]